PATHRRLPRPLLRHRTQLLGPVGRLWSARCAKAALSCFMNDTSFRLSFGAQTSKSPAVPTYLVKVTNKLGWVKPPILTNCANQQEAARVVAAMGDEGDQVEVRSGD